MGYLVGCDSPNQDGVEKSGSEVVWMFTEPSAILVISASLRVGNEFSLSKRHIFILTRYRLGSSLRNPWEERKQYANQVGTDGWMLLDALEAPTTPDWMKTLPAISTLHTMWEQQFEPREQGGRWRPEPALPAAQLINSPYDLDARNGKKRTTFWLGYKVHFSQTCDEAAPQLITHVETTPAPFSDEGVLSAIHTDLVGKDLLPDQHLVDAGYVTIAIGLALKERILRACAPWAYATRGISVCVKPIWAMWLLLLPSMSFN
jgi:hypothetical protein